MRTAHRLTRPRVDAYVSTPWELLARLRPTKRQVVIFLIVFGLIMIGGAAYAASADAASLPCVADHTCKQTQVMQPGELIPLRDMTKGGPKTMFETYGFASWYFDTDVDFNAFDGNTYLPTIMNGLVNLLGYLWVLVVYLAVGLSWWLFSSLNVPGLSDTVTTMLGSASGVVLQWLFPTAIAVGGAVAYVEGRRVKGSYYSQIVWTVAAGVLAVGLTTSPGIFVHGIDNVRNAGSGLVLSASNAAISTNDTTPFKTPKVDYSVNTPGDAMLRKSADSIWRGVVASPWCLAEFGSIDACKKYGKDILDAGADTAKRKDIIKNEIYQAEGNGDPDAGKKSPTGQWVAGYSWPQRLGVVVLALLIAIVFCALLLVLGFSALAGVVLTYLLLFAGVFFAALWIIPGRPRQWGVAWGETLIGAVLITLVALLTFGATLAVLTAMLAATANSGWMISMGLALTLMFVAFGFRNKIGEIVGAHSTGAGRAFLVGSFITRSAGRALPQAARGVRRASATRRATRSARERQEAFRERREQLRTASSGPGAGNGAPARGAGRGSSYWSRSSGTTPSGSARTQRPNRRTRGQAASSIQRGGLRPGPRVVERRTPTRQPVAPRQAPQPTVAPRASTRRTMASAAPRRVSNRLRRRGGGSGAR